MGAILHLTVGFSPPTEFSLPRSPKAATTTWSPFYQDITLLAEDDPNGPRVVALATLPVTPQGPASAELPQRHELAGGINKRYGQRKIRMAGRPANTLALYPSVPEGLKKRDISPSQWLEGTRSWGGQMLGTAGRLREAPNPRLDGSAVQRARRALFLGKGAPADQQTYN
jgi:hypothetical protein